MNEFPQVSLLITHYNRSKSLENLLESFRLLNCVFDDIVVSDDGSQEEHFQYIQGLQALYPFQLISTSKNKGLGNNINKGQNTISTSYTLYVQEDFAPSSLFPERLKDALDFMEKDRELDIVRFYAYKLYPYLKPFGKGFSEMYIKPFATNYKKIYYYSDHPHLRRSTFFEKFGEYEEGLKVDLTEYKMSVSFIKNKGKGLFYNEHYSLFTQKNSADEPSTVPQEERPQRNNLIIKILRYVYRQFKYNYDILFAEAKQSNKC